MSTLDHLHTLARTPLASVARRSVVVFGLFYVLWMTSYFDFMKDSLALVNPIAGDGDAALIVMTLTGYALVVSVVFAALTRRWSERRFLAAVVGVGGALTVSNAVALGLDSMLSWGSLVLLALAAIAVWRLGRHDLIWVSTALGIVASLYAWGDHVTFAIDSVSGNDAAPAAVVEVPETDNPLPSVYVLLLDELSLSLVNAYASFTELPNIGRLVEQGTYLPRAYSTTDLTMTSVPSALTGLLPSRERFARGNSGYETDWLRDANNLISDLERLGYRVTITPDIFGACAVVACSRLEAADLLEPTLNERDLFQFAVDHFVHQVSFGQQPAPDVGELFRGQAFAYLGGEQVDLGHDTDQPQFVFLHFMQTHYPYTHARDGTLHGREPVSFDHGTDDNAATIAANAFESVLWADLVLGPIVDALLALPAEERIVLLMSDHGVSWRDDPYFRHRGTMRTPQLHVPVVLLAPGIEPGVDPQLFPLIDTYPTLVDLINEAVGATVLTAPRGIDGLSLWASTTVRRERDHFAFSMGCRFQLRGDEWHFVELYKGFHQPPCGTTSTPAEELALTPQAETEALITAAAGSAAASRSP